jgi:hypothetical protein
MLHNMKKTTTTRSSYLLKEFDKPLYLGSYFGFTPIECPKVTPVDLKMIDECPHEEERLDAAEKAAFLRHYIERELNNLPHPLSVSYKKSAGKKIEYSFHVVGFPSAIAEALLIRTALSILIEEGYKHLVVEINSIGDKDSMASYERELNNYVKKMNGEIPPEHKKLLKDDVFELLKLSLPDSIKDHIPPSIASLSSPSRAHFKEMLECIETLGVEFRLAHTLLGNRAYTSQTLFAIRDLDDNENLVAFGSRYSRLTKKLGFKKELPAVALTIFSKKKEAPVKLYKELPKPKFYLVQLGREAKMRSLPLIELLRVHRIPDITSLVETKSYLNLLRQKVSEYHISLSLDKRKLSKTPLLYEMSPPELRTPSKSTFCLTTSKTSVYRRFLST